MSGVVTARNRTRRRPPPSNSLLPGSSPSLGESGRDLLGRAAVAVQLGAVNRHRSARNRRDECFGVVVDEHIRARLDGVHPLRRGSGRHARDAVPVRLLLETAGVGADVICVTSPNLLFEALLSRQGGIREKICSCNSGTTIQKADAYLALHS